MFSRRVREVQTATDMGLDSHVDDTRAPPPTVTAREGAVDDFAGVMELQRSVGFSGGLDFIPAMYRYWIHSKIGQIHLTVDGDKVVGIFVSTVIPGTDRVANMAGRVHPDYRRSGTKDLLYISGGQRMREKTPGATGVIYDALKSTYWDEMIPASQKTGHPIMVERSWVIHIHDRSMRSGFTRLVKEVPALAVRRLTAQEIIDFTEDGSIEELLLADGRYFAANHGWVSMPVQRETIRYASTTGEVRASFHRQSGKNSLKSVSFGSVMQLESNPRLDISYFGGDEEDLVNHVSSHVAHTLRVCQSHVVPVIIRQPIGLDRARLGKRFTNYFGERVKLSDVEEIPTCRLMSQTWEPVTNSKL